MTKRVHSAIHRTLFAAKFGPLGRYLPPSLVMMALMDVHWHRNVLLDHVRLTTASALRAARRQYHIVPAFLLFTFAVALNDGVGRTPSTTLSHTQFGGVVLAVRKRGRCRRAMNHEEEAPRGGRTEKKHQKEGSRGERNQKVC